MVHRQIIYLLFFLSGLSALIYQILWVRSFSLIFGGSHIAVTTVLSVFMAGLALGGWIGRFADRSSRLLRIYGILEIGIGASALLLLGLLKIYPELYILFVQMTGEKTAVLIIGRVVFAVIALLVPTTMMGVTLPVLASYAVRYKEGLGKYLAWLYGINTFGAVVGSLLAGFFFLRYFSVSLTFGIAILISFLVGILSVLLDRRSSGIKAADPEVADSVSLQDPLPEAADNEIISKTAVAPRLILIGIGVSGFCALGYEVLWTRVLSIVVGTTVYGYTIMLVAFLTGIALGGASYRFVFSRLRTFRSLPFWFGFIQIVIGICAFGVTYALRNLPNQAISVESWIQNWFVNVSQTLQATNFLMAFCYMLIPAFFMGLAFPLAGDIVNRAHGNAGKSTGETLLYNTIGAILGAAVSGFILIYLLGIERSLQLLTLINLTFGLLVCFLYFNLRFLAQSIVPLALCLTVFLSFSPDSLRMWDMKYFAIFNHNSRQFFSSPEDMTQIYENSEVLYFSEGVTSTISVIKIKGVNQGLNVNGRTVASSSKSDQQCQYTLGHLPMLLHKKPEKVWVLGMGTGMTAGAVSVHPEVESVTVVELEKHVVPAARTFSEFNHNFLDNPKVKVVFNDGRNFLLTTKERYDVLTADPIHPWSQGAAYLYTDEYYRLAASRMRAGGIMCQWLPIYELSPRDLQSVVKTFSNNFKYVYVWLTDYDAELIGSNQPIDIDLAELQNRIESSPDVHADLQRVNMDNAASFVSYCIMGPRGSRNFGKGAPLNTDNNLYLEFSAPDSKGKWEMISMNIASLVAYREDVTSLVRGDLAAALGTEQEKFKQAQELYDKAHIMKYRGMLNAPNYSLLMQTFERWAPWYAPGEFLVDEFKVFRARIPTLVNQTQLKLLAEDGTLSTVTLSVVKEEISADYIRIMLVDNEIKKIYGSFYVDAEKRSVERLVDEYSNEILNQINMLCEKEKAAKGVLDKKDVLQGVEDIMNRLKLGQA